jgi:head-tail adaptor
MCAIAFITTDKFAVLSGGETTVRRLRRYGKIVVSWKDCARPSAATRDAGRASRAVSAVEVADSDHTVFFLVGS